MLGATELGTQQSVGFTLLPPQICMSAVLWQRWATSAQRPGIWVMPTGFFAQPENSCEVENEKKATLRWLLKVLEGTSLGDQFQTR